MFAQFVARQLGHPSGLIGRWLLGPLWNRRNRPLNDVSLALRADDRVLEVGFGGGYLLRRMSAVVTDGFIGGVDISATLVEQCQARYRALIQAGKSAADGYYADNGVIACSHIELTDAGRLYVRNNCCTGGVDAQQSRNWSIRDNLIEGFWCSSGLSEHGIHLWRGCRDTFVERNTLKNNARGIGFGLVTRGSGRTYCVRDRRG